MQGRHNACFFYTLFDISYSVDMKAMRPRWSSSGIEKLELVSWRISPWTSKGNLGGPPTASVELPADQTVVVMGSFQAWLCVYYITIYSVYIPGMC